MNKREAKRLACFLAALIVQNAVDCGWETEARFTDKDGNFREKDHQRFLETLDELIEELLRRGKL